MAAERMPAGEIGSPAADFSLTGIDGRTYTLAGSRGPKGLLVMFICNHCPYVKAVIDRVVGDARALAAKDIGSIAIMPNDTARYPDDSFDNMKRFAAAHDFPFPYVIDESQDVARAYGAVCTPDFFGYDADLALRYRGRLDESRLEPAPNARRELLEAMIGIAETGEAPAEQLPSMGCSIKWREA